MKKVRPYWDPNDLTPEERADRVIELLAEAAVRMADEEKYGIAKPKDAGISDAPTIVVKLQSGPVPCGQEPLGFERVENEREMKWIKRIQELHEAGLSTEKIAKRLSEEDKESRRAGKWSRSAVWRILGRLRV